MSPREINLLLRITGWADEKLQEGSSYCGDGDYAFGYDDGKKSAFNELLDYIGELKEEVK